jgi:putative drug exporter of the RND superfamily
MTVVPETSPQDEATTALVRTLRDDVIPVAAGGLVVHVTGSTATSIDVTDHLAGRMPVFFAAVLGLSFVALTVVFRSVLVPLKAVVMNIASISAAYGVVVAVFQWGWGAELLGISGGPINPFIPLMLFAIVFGLSMDYEVFLLSRIREEYDRTGDPVTSVADGWRRRRGSSPQRPRSWWSSSGRSPSRRSGRSSSSGWAWRSPC